MGAAQQGEGDDRQRDSAAAEVGDGHHQRDGEGGWDWLVVLGNFLTIKTHNCTLDL